MLKYLAFAKKVISYVLLAEGQLIGGTRNVSALALQKKKTALGALIQGQLLCAASQRHRLSRLP